MHGLDSSDQSVSACRAMSPDRFGCAGTSPSFHDVMAKRREGREAGRYDVVGEAPSYHPRPTTCPAWRATLPHLRHAASFRNTPKEGSRAGNARCSPPDASGRTLTERQRRVQSVRGRAKVNSSFCQRPIDNNHCVGSGISPDLNAYETPNAAPLVDQPIARHRVGEGA